MNAPQQTADVDLRLVEIFRSVTGNPELDVHLGMDRKNVPGWNSMAHIQLVLAVENRFGIRFSASEMANFRTVGQLWELIRTKT